MGYDWTEKATNTWREWYNSAGKLVLRISTVFVLSGSALFWWQRTTPPYPMADDEALIKGALWQRLVAVTGAGAILGVDPITNVFVGVYVPKDFYFGGERLLGSVRNGFYRLRDSYILMYAETPLIFNGRDASATNISYLTPVMDWEWMGDEWWRQWLFRDAEKFGHCEYMTNKYSWVNYDYLNEDVLNQIAKPLVRMHTLQRNLNATYRDRGSHPLTAIWDADGEGDTEWLALMDAWANFKAAETEVEGGLSFETLCADYDVLQQSMRATTHDYGVDGWRASITEIVNFTPRAAYVPPLDLPHECWSAGLYSGHPYGGRFAHPLPSVMTNRWRVLEAEQVDSVDASIFGNVSNAWASTVFRFEGRLGEDWSKVVQSVHDTYFQGWWQRHQIYFIRWDFDCFPREDDAQFWP